VNRTSGREREGDAVDQARAAAVPAQVHPGRLVKRPIDHLDADRRQDVVDERFDGRGPQARTGARM
jgi:hypothetical protein